MYYPLLSIAIALILCLALGCVPRWAEVGRALVPLGMGVALVLSLWREGLEGGGIVGRAVGWPQPLLWLGAPVFRTDALSAGLGAWCLFLGTLYLLKMAIREETTIRLAVSALIVGTLYSLVHTDNLLAFAGQMLGLVLLVWAYDAGGAESSDDIVIPLYGRQLGALGVGALMLVGAVMLLGRTTGGNYSLVGMSISALTVWPLVLLIAAIIAWVGLTPFTGWSAEGRSDVHQAILHSLVIGLPVVTLVLRLEALLSAQALVGTLPGEWHGFTTALAWLGGITALVSAADLLFWAGKSRWVALLTAHTMGLTLWGLGLDTPLGRYAAMALMLAYGAGRVTQELCENAHSAQRLIAWASLGAAPLGVGFVGVWLLGAALTETGRPALAIALIGIVVLAAAGLALGAILSPPSRSSSGRWSEYLGGIGTVAAGALLLSGILPSLWLPYVRNMVSIAGGNPGADGNWTGLSARSGQSLPVLLMLGGAIIMVLLTWLVTAFAKSRVKSSGTLLPTALERMTQAQESSDRVLDKVADPFTPLLMNPPAAVWWLSLAWLETGIVSTGTLLARLGRRSGRLLGRMEGRFYLPLALIMALLLVLAVTR